MPRSKSTTARLVVYSGEHGKGTAVLIRVPKSGHVVWKNIVDPLKTATQALNNGSDDSGIEDEFLNEINNDREFEASKESFESLLFLLPKLKEGTYGNDEFNFKLDISSTDKTKPFNKPPPTTDYLKAAVVIKQVDSGYSEDGEVLKTLAGAVSVTIAHGVDTRKTLTAKESTPSIDDDAEAAFLQNVMGAAKASTSTDNMNQG